jgi:flagellar protein FlaF
MGFSVSASAAIIFISFLIAVSTLYTAWDNSYSNVQAAREDWYSLRESQIYFNINVTNLNLVDIDGDGADDLEVVFEYRGQSTRTHIDIILDGRYHEHITSSDLKYLIPGITYVLEIQDGVPDTNTHSAVISFGNGCSEKIVYHYGTIANDVILDSQVVYCPLEVS